VGAASIKRTWAQRQSNERGRSSSKSQDELATAVAISESDVEGLKDIAFVFRHEIPSDVGRPVRNEFDSGGRPLHREETSVGDAGLAHYVVVIWGVCTATAVVLAAARRGRCVLVGGD
jgi:hypothetical protein